MENQPNNKIFIYLLGIFFVLFVGTGLFMMRQGQQSQPQEQAATTTKNPTPSPSLAPVGPLSQYLFLKTDAPEETASYKVGSEVNFNLVGNSVDNNITGYDVVIAYEPTAFDLIKAESVLPDFKVYSYKRDNYLILTVVKELQSITPTVFSDTKLITLTFQPKKTGRYNFSLISTNEKGKTDFITDKTETIMPQVNSLTVEVK